MALDEVPTPALVVDLGCMERNIETFGREIADRGGTLRPHIKTHKSPEIAALQSAAGAHGIAAAKPSEAQPFHDAGFEDIVIAFPSMGRDKWDRIAVMAQSTRITANVDSREQAQGLSAAACARGATVGVQIEIDSGFHRVGIPIDAVDDVADFARLLAALPGLDFAGITTFRGKLGPRLARMTPEEAGLEEGEMMVALAEQLRADGIDVREVTAGSTITGLGVTSVPGITEVRAGTYVFYDAMMVGLGVARPEQVAATILATVVSTRRPGWATIDAGTKAFSGDRGMAGATASSGGVVSAAAHLDASVVWTTEEHGMVRLGEGVSLEVGERIEFVPYHVCTAVNLCDELVGVRDGRVERIYPVRARGCRT